MDEDLYELMRTGWRTPYPDTTNPGAVPLAMQAPNLYPAEKLASFGPAAAPGVGDDPPVVTVDACQIGGPTATDDGEGGSTTQNAPGCKVIAPIPPDCNSNYRCIIVFESPVDECTPEWFGCPRTLGVFCMDPVARSLPMNQWFVVDDPSWLTGSSDPVAWYLIEMPVLPGTSRICSPATTNQAPANGPPSMTNMPVGNYAPCTLQDLADMLALCKLEDENHQVTIDGITFQLPADFCATIQDVVNKVENPGKNLGAPTNPDGSHPVTPIRVGVCISLWQIDWDNCQETTLPNGTKCKGAWSNPKLQATNCYSTLTWMIFLASLNQSGQGAGNGVIVPGSADDPESDCHRQFYMEHGRCYTVGESCRIQTHIRPWKNKDGSDRCVCPSPGGGWHECPCGSPGAVPGGYDPCDPANGYVPPTVANNCEGGGISLTDPAGGTGGNTSSGSTVTQPNGGKPREDVEPKVVVPRDYGKMPQKPAGCAQLPCSYQCSTCHAALLRGGESPTNPQGSWGAVLAFHACEANLCETTEVAQRKSCKISGPCTNGSQKSWRTQSCSVGDKQNQHKYCWDPDENFPGTGTPDFYNSCPVCKCYKEGSWVCRGNPKMLTKGPWTLKCECKSNAAWTAFFKEVRCGQWREAAWSSCFFGSCSSYECGVTFVDEDGIVHSGDCPPKNVRDTLQWSGDDPGTITIGYTPKYAPCGTAPGSIVVRVKEYNQPWGGDGVQGTPSKCVPGGMTNAPNSCSPASGLSLNCATGTSYTTTDYYTYGLVPTPRESVGTPRYHSCGSGGCNCHYSYNITYSHDPCMNPADAYSGYAGDSYTYCPNTTGPDYPCCAGEQYDIVVHADRCPQIDVGVMCPDGRRIGKGGGSMCGCPTESKSVACIVTTFTRNDCKTPPTPT